MARDEMKKAFDASEDGCYFYCHVCESNIGYEEEQIQDWARDYNWKK
jgi:hypothetical protein